MIPSIEQIEARQRVQQRRYAPQPKVAPAPGSDYVTVLQTNDPANKRVFMREGKAVKKSGRPVFAASAITVHVPDAAAMLGLQMELADNPKQVLVSGYVPGTEDGKVFYVGSVKHISKLTGESYSGGFVEHEGQRWIARQKQDFVPSSWWLIDRDFAPGLPKAWAAMSEEEYIEAVTAIIPGFSAAPRVRVASTTGRVLVNGVPMSASGAHCWFQVKDPSDIVGFGKRAKVRAAELGWGFMKRDKNDKGVLWTIFDPSVFSPERVVYDGQPAVRGEGLSLAPPDITAVEGLRVDTTRVPAPTGAVRQIMKEKFNIEVTQKGGVLTVVNRDYLTLDTQVETYDHGTVTVREFYDSGADKWRCQSTFRDSTTWNGALKRGFDGMPHLIDYGGETRYELASDNKYELLCEAFRHAK